MQYELYGFLDFSTSCHSLSQELLFSRSENGFLLDFFLSEYIFHYLLFLTNKENWNRGTDRSNGTQSGSQGSVLSARYFSRHTVRGSLLRY